MSDPSVNPASQTPGPDHAAGADASVQRLDSQPISGPQAILANFTPAEIVEAAAVTPTKGAKAIVGAVLAGIVGAASPLLTELADPKTDWSMPGTYLVPIVAGLVGAGLVGGGVYIPTNKAKA